MAREDRDFSIWKFEADYGLVQSEHQSMKQMMEHKLDYLRRGGLTAESSASGTLAGP
jgi:hypothetical protein